MSPLFPEEIDHRLLMALRDCGANPRVAAVTRAFSRGGEHGAVWLAAGLAGATADRRRRTTWLRGTALIGGAHLASMALKLAVRRPRPRLQGQPPLVRTAGRHSFPSSHAASAAAAVVALGALHAERSGAVTREAVRRKRSGPVRREAWRRERSGPLWREAWRPVGTALPALAAGVCVSRLVAGVHYPTDVAAGAALGALTARLGAGWMGVAPGGAKGARRRRGKRRASAARAPRAAPAVPYARLLPTPAVPYARLLPTGSVPLRKSTGRRSRRAARGPVGGVGHG